MLSNDLFYSKLCDMVVGDSVEPADEDMKAVIDDGGNVPVGGNKSQRLKFLMLLYLVYIYKLDCTEGNGPFV